MLERPTRTSTSLAAAIPRVAQSPVNERLGEISAVLCRAVNIRSGIDCSGTGRGSLAQSGIICRFAEKPFFGLRQPDRMGPDARKADRSLFYLSFLNLQGCGRSYDSEVTLADIDFVKAQP